MTPRGSILLSAMWGKSNTAQLQKITSNKWRYNWLDSDRIWNWPSSEIFTAGHKCCKCSLRKREECGFSCPVGMCEDDGGHVIEGNQCCSTLCRSIWSSSPTRTRWHEVGVWVHGDRTGDKLYSFWVCVSLSLFSSNHTVIALKEGCFVHCSAFREKLHVLSHSQIIRVTWTWGHTWMWRGVEGRFYKLLRLLDWHKVTTADPVPLKTRPVTHTSLPVIAVVVVIKPLCVCVCVCVVMSQQH